jgi:hypothetical protein
MLIGREHNWTFENISKWNINRVIVVTVFVSLLTNVAHAFQYELHSSHNYRYFPGLHYLYIYQSYPAIDSSSTALEVYLLVYFIINFVAFFIINTLVEVILVKKLHTELVDKKERLEKLAANSRKSSAPESIMDGLRSRA